MRLSPLLRYLDLRRLAALAIGAALAATLFAPRSAAEIGADVRIGPRSGLPVPRYAALKFDEVNGRDGPSFEHRVLWSYHRRGLPVLIIEEDLDWWKVRDPDGDAVWMHRRVLDNRRMAIVADHDALLRRRPDADAPVVAIAEPGVLFEIEACEGDWRRVDGARATGWVAADALWGAGCG